MAAGMLARAHTAAPLVRADALHLPLRDASIDGAISGFALRNVVDIGACFREAARVIRPGGRAVFLEVSEPRNAALRRLHALYFRRIVPVDRRAHLGPAGLPVPAGVHGVPAAAPELLDCSATRASCDCRRVALGAGAAQLLIGTRR